MDINNPNTNRDSSNDTQNNENRHKKNQLESLSLDSSELKEYVNSEFRAIAINARRCRSVLTKLDDGDLKKIKETMDRVISEETDKRLQERIKKEEEDRKIADSISALASQGIDKEKIKEFLSEH